MDVVNFLFKRSQCQSEVMTAPDWAGEEDDILDRGQTLGGSSVKAAIYYTSVN